MKIGKIISTKERKILLIAALMSFILASISLIHSNIEDYNREVRIHQADLVMEANDGLSFSKDYGTDYRPFHRFQLTVLTVVIFLGLLWEKRFLSSTAFTLLSILIFAFWFIRTNRAIELNSLYMSGTPRLLKIATYYDYSAWFIISILFCWQISIFARPLIGRQNN